MSRVRHRKTINPFRFQRDVQRPDWPSMLRPNQPIEVDLGFGRGEFILEMAEQRPDVFFVGLELRDYLIDTLIVVPPEARLVVDAGTRMQFGPDAGLIARARALVERVIPVAQAQIERSPFGPELGARLEADEETPQALIGSPIAEKMRLAPGDRIELSRRPRAAPPQASRPRRTCRGRARPRQLRRVGKPRNNQQAHKRLPPRNPGNHRRPPRRNPQHPKQRLVNKQWCWI